MPDFLVNALIAGTPIALACGLVGWFAVARAQVFAGDALSHVAFTGAVAAAAAGIDVRIGLFCATVGAGLALGRGGGDLATGLVLVWVLGVGVLLIAVVGGGSGETGARTLFGSVFGLDKGDSLAAAGVAVAVCGALLVLARPLLFATLDPIVAAVRGVRVGAVSLAFLALLAVTAAEATQAVGALLLLGLVAAPAGAAHRLVAAPFAGLALAGALAVGAMWAGLALSVAVPQLPPSTAVIGCAAALWPAATILARWGR